VKAKNPRDAASTAYARFIRNTIDRPDRVMVWAEEGVAVWCFRRRLESTGPLFLEMSPAEATNASVEHPSWSKPCEAMFRHLAEHDLARIITMLEGGGLDRADLSFAAEALGGAQDVERAVTELLKLVRHPSPPVREGAVYGLGKLAGRVDRARNALREIARGDEDQGVREAALAAEV
jgi:HEAT repeats